MIPPPTVRTRITLWNVGVVALVLIASGIGLRRHVEVQLLSQVDRQLGERAGRADWRFGRPGPPFGPERPPRFGPFPPPRWRNDDGRRAPASGQEQPQRFVMRIFDRSGRDLVVEANPLLDREAFARALQGVNQYSQVQFEGEEFRLLSHPIQREGAVVGVVQIGTSLVPTHEAIDQVTRTLLMWIPLALLMAGLGGAFLTGRALRPVREITRAAARIEARNLSDRLPIQGRDEFSQLAAMLNGMLARLEEAFDRQKRFTADASHELRTPLATIKATSSLAQEDVWDADECQAAMGTIEAASDRAHRILQDLLLLARSDSDQLAVAQRAVSLPELLDGALQEAKAGTGYRAGAAAGTPWPRVVFELNRGSPLWVWGDDAHLVRLFVNLLQNAQRHTPPEGTITLAARATEATVAVTVADTGEGIAPEHLPHLGERFYRADPARARASGGSGLGLALSRSIVAAHGGDLEIDSVLGQGTVVTVTLRRATPTAQEAGSPVA